MTILFTATAGTMYCFLMMKKMCRCSLGRTCTLKEDSIAVLRSQVPVRQLLP